jgi:hypothetical protein
LKGANVGTEEVFQSGLPVQVIRFELGDAFQLVGIQERHDRDIGRAGEILLGQSQKLTCDKVAMRQEGLSQFT